MKKRIGFFLMLFLAATFGCMPSKDPRVSSPTRVHQSIPDRVLFDDIPKKILFYNRLLDEEVLSEQDKQKALNLLASYEKLQRLTSSQPSGDDCSNMLRELYSNLGSIDEKYFTERQDPMGEYSDIMGLYSKKRDQIINAHLSGDFQGVIELCIELKNMFGSDSLTPDIGLIFALSLAKKGMMAEAIDIGEGVARDLETSPNILQLRTKIAEWHLQQGQREKAITEYEKLADTLDERGLALRSLSQKIDLTKKETPVIDPTQRQGMTLSKKITVEQLLLEVDKLLEQNRFNEARNLLFVKKNDVISASDTEAVNQALKKLELAEEDYLEKKISMISMKTDLEYARRLLEEEKYEEVIERLEAISSDQENSREIKALKQFAVEKLINRERNRAAKLFLSAKNTKDPVQKKEDLVEALETLNKLIEQYPSSPLNQKLISHASVVEEELEKLDGNTTLTPHRP